MQKSVTVLISLFHILLMVCVRSWYDIQLYRYLWLMC